MVRNITGLSGKKSTLNNKDNKTLHNRMKWLKAQQFKGSTKTRLKLYGDT